MGNWQWVLRVCMTSATVVGCSASVGEEGGEATETSGEVAGEAEGWEYTDPESGDVYMVDYNRRSTVVGSEDSAGPAAPKKFSDEIGSIEQFVTKRYDALSRTQFEYVECDATSIATKKTNCGCSVSPGYVMIGGGAYVSWSQPGAMLYESRPMDSDNNGPGTTWLAASKAHMADASHTLTCEVVGVRLQGPAPNYDWLPAATVKSYINYSRITTNTLAVPSGQCNVPDGKFLLGGGARANWTGNGLLLTESYPNSNTSWFAKAKAHHAPDAATLDVYCIGISPTIPTFGAVITGRESRGLSNTGKPAHNVGVSADTHSLAVCAGGRATYTGDGRLLYGMRVYPGGGSAASKAHWSSDNSGVTQAWVTQFRW